MFIHFAISMRAFPIAMTSVTKWSFLMIFHWSQLREPTGDRCNSSIRAAASNILDFRFACGPQAEQRLDEQMLWLLDDKMCFSCSVDLLKRGKPKYIPQYKYAQMTLSVFSSPVQPNGRMLGKPMPWKQWTEVLWLLAITRWFVYLWGFIWRSHGDFNCCFSEGLLLLWQSRSLDPWRKERYKSCEGFLSEAGAHPSNLQNFGGLYNSCADHLRTKKSLREPWTWAYDVLKICNFYPWYHDISWFFGFFWWFQNWIVFRVLETNRWEEMIPSSLCCFHCGHGIIPAGKPGTAGHQPRVAYDISNVETPVVWRSTRFPDVEQTRVYILYIYV